MTVTAHLYLDRLHVTGALDPYDLGKPKVSGGLFICWLINIPKTYRVLTG